MRKKELVQEPQPQPAPHIRWMIRRDMPSVFEIERRCFECPKTEEDFLRWLRQRNCIGMVCEKGDDVLGFMVYELHKTSLEILDFSVHPNHQRCGVGRAMIDRLLAKLASHRRNKIGLYVSERRLDAQVFFRAMKFEATRIERNFYGDDEDAYRMVLSIDGDSQEPVNRVAGYLECP